MGIIETVRKYAFVLVLSLSVIYVYAQPSLEDLSHIRWLDGISGVINKRLASARPEADISSVDARAAADVDEDLDYRIAQRTKSTDGWRSFLAAHPNGPHAKTARVELDRLIPAAAAPSSSVAQVLNGGTSDSRAQGVAASRGDTSSVSETATLAVDETCSRDEDRLEQLSERPASDEAIRFLNELRCEKLRPELFRLTEHLDTQDSDAVVAAQTHSSKVARAVAARRAIEPRNKTDSRVASHGLQSRRNAKASAPRGLPPLLLALFGDESANAAPFQRTRPSWGPGHGGATGGVASAASAGGGSSSASGGGSSGGGSGGGGGPGGGGSGGGGAGGGGGSGGGSGGGGGGGGGSGGGGGGGSGGGGGGGSGGGGGGGGGGH